MRGLTGNANIMPGTVNSYLFWGYLDAAIPRVANAARTDSTPVEISGDPPKWQRIRENFIGTCSLTLYPTAGYTPRMAESGSFNPEPGTAAKSGGPRPGMVGISLYRIRSVAAENIDDEQIL